jgi:hypothetical protein
MIGDPVLEEMAIELKQALELRGLDPANPPINEGAPPSARLFAEYQRRDGTVYTDADYFAQMLVDRVVTLSS